MPDGYVTGSSGMSYCNQTPFPPREGWGLGTRLVQCETTGSGFTQERAAGGRACNSINWKPVGIIEPLLKIVTCTCMPVHRHKPLLLSASTYSVFYF